MREAQDLERLFQKERKNEDVEPDKYLDHALKIWEELGEGSGKNRKYDAKKIIPQTPRVMIAN